VRADAKPATPFPIAPGGDQPSGQTARPDGSHPGEAPPDPDQRGGAPHGAADRRAHHHAGSTHHQVQSTSDRRARQGAGRHQLRGREAEQLPGLLREQVLLEDGSLEGGAFEAHLAVTVEGSLFGNRRRRAISMCLMVTGKE